MKLPSYCLLSAFYLGLLYAHLEAYEKIGLWTTWNIPCGIAVYSKHVTDGLLKLGYNVTHYDYRLRPEAIVTHAIEDQLHLLIIQYEGAIMPPRPILLRTIQQLKNAGIKVVIIMHAEPRYAQRLVNAAHATIYHKQPQYLRNLSKVHVFPMGVPVFNPAQGRRKLREKYGFSLDDKIIVSTGFMLPSKEIDTILEHLAPTIKRDPSIKLQLIHPLTPRNPTECALGYKHVVEVIKKYNLDDQVILVTNFIPQQELSERIHISDLGYQWLCVETQATSASTKEYISARTPLVIPNVSHFHDVHYHGIKVTPFDHEHFVQAILELLYQSKHLRSMRHHLERVYQQLNYGTVIKRYHEIFQALLSNKE